PENAEVIAGQIGLRGQVYERMLNRHLMLREAEAQGLRVTDAEVRQAVTEQPGFQVGERFDYETYRQILAQNRLTPAEFEASLRDDLLLTKLQRALVA
ncbi:MAG: peptidylprolyl isomerase, partial [Gammaproteobacteria bacterium]|nr:peptidylprolyl isomerase [Gammaproteobacteria bacterium]NIT64194.1 peptidylprolyl isomerase [Gammaproteobacteria bacterium]NIV21137.1 peptidylprolyl isomerase [Gammaproteobacteria bacterium]NIY32774.1 peptidylprolyl isomerase [Gammaproteobacteria bacterium]